MKSKKKKPEVIVRLNGHQVHIYGNGSVGAPSITKRVVPAKRVDAIALMVKLAPQRSKLVREFESAQSALNKFDVKNAKALTLLETENYNSVRMRGVNSDIHVGCQSFRIADVLKVLKISRQQRK